jgi:hypothetical protein
MFKHVRVGAGAGAIAVIRIFGSVEPEPKDTYITAPKHWYRYQVSGLRVLIHEKSRLQKVVWGSVLYILLSCPFKYLKFKDAVFKVQHE